MVDGSGTVTGLAFYRLQQDKLLLSKENEQLNDKIQRLKNEYMGQKDRLNKERYIYVQYLHLNFCIKFV